MCKAAADSPIPMPLLLRASDVCQSRQSRCADVCNVMCAAEALKSQAGWWQRLAICQLGVAQCLEALGRYDAAIRQCDLVTTTAQKAAEPLRLLVDAHLCRFRVREQPLRNLSALARQLLHIDSITAWHCRRSYSSAAWLNSGLKSCFPLPANNTSAGLAPCHDTSVASTSCSIAHRCSLQMASTTSQRWS